jgi:PBP1b-binding outer membrane lipoprotein LpoB
MEEIYMIKRLIGLLLLAMLMLSGCLSSPTPNQTPKLSIKAKNTIEKVSKKYGEPHPKIIEIKITEEETTHKPMYAVFLEGIFNKGELKSQNLEFSMLKDCTDVWALTSDSWQETDVDLTK